MRLGLARRDSGRPEEALHDFHEAVVLLEDSSNDISRTRLKRLAVLYVEIGRIEDRLGRFANALQSFSRAREKYEAIIPLAPIDSRPRRGLAMCDHVIGNLHCDLGERDQAIASFLSALELEEALVRDFPENDSCSKDLIGTRRRFTEVGVTLAER